MEQCQLKFDARDYTSEQTRLASMHWPDAIETREAGGQDEAELADALRRIAAHPFGADSIALLDAVKTLLIDIDAQTEGAPPVSFCDDLLDYWSVSPLDVAVFALFGFHLCYLR